MKTCALVIGHKKTSQGAVNKLSGISEYEFNNQLAIDIFNRVVDVDIKLVYRRTYKLLPEDINQLNPDFIISLHCNAFNRRASGTEVLYYYRSQKGRLVAEILQRHIVSAMKSKDRGVKPKTTEDRGGYILKYTDAPCVISEPFFIDNDKSLENVTKKRDILINAYASAIMEIASSI